VKVLDATGAGLTSDVIAALQFLVENRGSLGVNIINLSLGHPIFESAESDPLVRAVERAVAAGIVVVVAAGNKGIDPATGLPGYGGIQSPGNAPGALTVGSVNMNDTTSRVDDVVNNYSSRGPTRFDGYVKPDVVAPGYRLIAPAAPGAGLANKYP